MVENYSEIPATPCKLVATADEGQLVLLRIELVCRLVAS